MYQALYRKWRPATFDDVYGQEHITSILKNEVESGKLSHAYLFCGPRGTGKTTCAKIISKAANCEHPVGGNPCGKCHSCISIADGTATDVVEMDAASNNGVDNIRDLRDSVVYTPADLKYRVYIIDEVHMLSPSAFNALLKTLEEPPSHVIFILATTELQKIPATVLSRCQRFDFRRVAPSAIISRMKTVCEGEGIKADEGSLELIARLSQGGFRDALNMLEYCAGGGHEITLKNSIALLGASPIELLSGICDEIAEKDISGALEKLDEVYSSSRDIAVFWRELISFCRDMLLYVATRGKYSCESLTAHSAEHFTVAQLLNILKVFTSAEGDMTRLPSGAKLYAEMALVRVCDPSLDGDMSSVLARISALEDRLSQAPHTPPQAEGSRLPEPKSEKKEEKPAPAGGKALSEKAPAAPEKQEAKSEPKSVRIWAEVIRKAEQKDMSVGSFLKDTLAFTDDDGRLYIKCSNDFTMMMLSDEGRKSLIASVASSVLVKNITPQNIIFSKMQANEKKMPINDLIDTEEN